jgi:hypothetical protein
MCSLHEVHNVNVYCHTTCFPSQITSRISVKFCMFTDTHHGAEPFLRSRQLCTYSRTSQNFMEPEGSLLCSREPSSSPYPEPDEASPYRPILFLLRSMLMLSSHVRLDLPGGLFPSNFSTKTICNFLFAHACYMPCPSHAP